MKKGLLIFLFLPLYGSFAQDSIAYKVFYDKNSAKAGLKVQVTYENVANTDSTVFYFSNTNWGEEDLFECLEIEKKENRGITFHLDADANRIVVYHAGQDEVSLVYRIRQDYLQSDADVFFRPRVTNDFFRILGVNLFVVPYHFTRSPFDREFDVNIEWIGFPKDFVIHNTFASQERHQRFRTPLWDGLYKSLFVGGDYRIYNFNVQDRPVYFAIRGIWHNGYTDNFLFDNFRKAVTSQRDFWKDYKQDFFTIIITPTISESTGLGSSINGSAYKNGFDLYGTNNMSNDKDTYLYLLYHELMHEWIGGRIANKHGDLNLWFSEGFTEYYTYKNRLRAEDISLAEYQELFNDRIIHAYWENPWKNIPNYRIKDDLWEDYYVEKVAYWRGAVFAFWLDNQILLKSNYEESLDDLMRELLEYCVVNNAKFSDELLIDLARKYLNKDISSFFQKHIICGEDIPLTDEKWIEGFRFEIFEDIPILVSDESALDRYIID